MKIAFSMLIILLFSFVAFGQDEAGKGIALYLQADYKGAITVLQKVVETDESNRDAWFYLGMSFSRTNNKKEALKALRKGDSISSDDSSRYDKELKIVSKPHPRYTDEARTNLVAGTVRIAVEFGADGSINAVIPVQSLPYGLTENCVVAAQNIKFEPAVKNGKPVAYIKVLPYVFEIY